MFYAIPVAIILIIAGEKAMGKGLILGTLFSIINFVIMGILIEKQVVNAGTKTRARVFSFLYMFSRLFILAIPLVVSIKAEAYDFFATVAGIFMIQFTILFNNFVVNRFTSIRKA